MSAPPVSVGIMLPSRETAMTGRHDARGRLPYLPDVNAYERAWDRIRGQAVRDIAPALYATVNLNEDKARADEELDEYLRAHYGQPLDVMRYVQVFRGGSVQECLDWLARYADAG